MLAELEKLAFAPDRRPFAAALAAATGASAEDMGKVVGDRSGEPLALVLAALGMTPEAATRIFLMGDPAIAHSYERVAALQQLVADISSQTARRLVIRFLDAARRPLRYVRRDRSRSRCHAEPQQVRCAFCAGACDRPRRSATAPLRRPHPQMRPARARSSAAEVAPSFREIEKRAALAILDFDDPQVRIEGDFFL